MKWTPWMMALALTVSAQAATALTMCEDDSKCEAGEACHGGYCVAKTQQCATDAGCKAHETCDFTCPLGGWATGSSGGSTDGAGSSGSSGSSGAMPADGGSSSDKAAPDAGTSESNTDTSGSGVVASSPPCPKDVGLCMIDAKKVTPSASCKALCDVIAKCDSIGGGSSSGSSGTGVPSTDPAEPPKEGSGSGFAPGDGGSSTEADAGSSETPTEPADGGGAGAPDGPDGEGGDVPVETQPDVAGCAMICTIFELEAIAATELKALSTCVASNATATCDVLETTCKAEIDAMEKASEAADDVLQAKMHGGFSTDVAASGGGGDKGTANEAGAPGQLDASSNADGGNKGAQSGTSSSAASSGGGCTASPVGHNSGAMLALLALGLLIAFRRREA